MINLIDIHMEKKLHEVWLLQLANVVGVGVGYKNGNPDEKAILVYVTKKLHEIQLKPEDLIPKELGGFKTDVVESGEITLRSHTPYVPVQSHTDRERRPGVTIGHKDITAGTLGCLAKLKETGEIVLLSNAHVFTHDATAKEVPVRAIIQPGAYDGGVFPEDHAANLYAYSRVTPLISDSTCPVSRLYAWIGNFVSEIFGRQTAISAVAFNEDGINIIDAAIAKPIVEFDPIVKGLSKPDATVFAELGSAVTKSGRTTGITQGKVSAVDLTVNVNYGTGIAMFTDQIGIEGIGGEFSAGGDSGSVIFQSGTSAVCGLLFAGSSTITIANRIHNVFDLLGITF